MTGVTENEDLVPWHISDVVKKKTGEFDDKCAKMDTRKYRSKSDRDALVSFGQKIGCNADLF